MGCGCSSKSPQVNDQMADSSLPPGTKRRESNEPDLQALKSRVIEIRSQLDSGYLFCDKEFPANINSIYYNASNMANMAEAKNVVWKRAKVKRFLGA